MENTGRPKVMNDAIVRKLEECLRAGCSIDKACQLSGIGRATYYDYCRTDMDFSDKMARAREWPVELARKVVIRAIENGDLATSKWYLERKAAKEFGKYITVSDDNVPSRETGLDWLKQIAEQVKDANKNSQPQAPPQSAL